MVSFTLSVKTWENTMTDRRASNEEFSAIRNEMVELKGRLKVIDAKMDDMSEQIAMLDSDFRTHEMNEKPMFDEILMAVHNNSVKAEEIRDSVKGYVELQEDLTVFVRFTKKVGRFMTAVGKFTIIFGVSGAALKYLYEIVDKYLAGIS